MTVTLLGPVPASEELQASPKVHPTGTVMLFAGDVAPTGWVMCDGQAVSRSSPLGLKLGPRYGTGDGSTTFNVPNFNRRFPLGLGVAGMSDGSIDHAHGAGGLYAAQHYHLAGGYVMPNHYHHHNVYLPNHQHTYVVNDSVGYKDGHAGCGIFVEGPTGYMGEGGGIGGGIYDAYSADGGPVNVRLTGNTDWGQPAVTGNTAAAEAPWQGLSFVIKT